MVLIEFKLIDGGEIVVILGAGFAYGEKTLYLGGTAYEVIHTKDEIGGMIRNAMVQLARAQQGASGGGIILPGRN